MPPSDRNPEASSDALASANWQRFAGLVRTEDVLARERQGWRGWLALPLVTFLVPVDDASVRERMLAWHAALANWMPYRSHPAERLHISLHHVGHAATGLRLMWPHTWSDAALNALAAKVRPVLEESPACEVLVGPLNAFAPALFAEVHDPHDELRRLRATLRRALPLRARPGSPFKFLPHITLGYWGAQPVPPLLTALAPFRQLEPIPLRLERVKLTVYDRRAAPLGPDVLHLARERVIAEYVLGG